MKNSLLLTLLAVPPAAAAPAAPAVSVGSLHPLYAERLAALRERAGRAADKKDGAAVLAQVAAFEKALVRLDARPDKEERAEAAYRRLESWANRLLALP